MADSRIEEEDAIRQSMDRMYRYTRHVYDASRKFFLLGRDRLVNELQAKSGEKVCEIGCGTGRNLLKCARSYPDAFFYGLDASEEMLKSADIQVKKYIRNYGGAISLAQGYAQNFSPDEKFGVANQFDKVFFSYSLSMIPPWQQSLDHALNLLKPGGKLYIVDFGEQEKLPQWFRFILFKFLDVFGVHYRPELVNYIKTLDKKSAGKARVESLFNGYTVFITFEKF